MEPALQRGQTVIVSYGARIRRGDIVVLDNNIFGKPHGADAKPAFLRCVALPGDTLRHGRQQLSYVPMVVPRRGMSIPLDYDNYVTYKDLITRHEGSTIEWRDGAYHVDGKAARRYTFMSNYVYLSNDNRSDLSDSRSFGLVPADVIKGKILFDF